MSKQNKVVRYVIFAVSWAVLLFLLALTLPFVSARNSSVISGTPRRWVAYSPVPTNRITVVTFDGIAPPLWLAGLIVLALLVGALLRYAARVKDALVLSVARLLSGAIVIAGILGFFTFLFVASLAIVPIGVFLLLACNCISPFGTKYN